MANKIRKRVSILNSKQEPDGTGTWLHRVNHYSLFLRWTASRCTTHHDGYDDLYMKAHSDVDKYYLRKCGDVECSLKPYAKWLRGPACT